MIISLRQLLACPADAYPPGHILAYRDAMPITWGEFGIRVGAWQAALETRKEPQVVLYQRDGLEFMAALLAIWRLGKQALLPANNLPATLTRLQQDSHCFVGEFAGIDRVTPVAGARPLVDIAPVAGDSIALVLFTSGSGGEPEPVAKSFTQLEAELDTLERFRGAQLADACVTGSVSHQHIYGLLFRLLWPLASGRPFIHRERDYWEELIADAHRHSPVVIVTSPAHLERLSSAPFPAVPCAIFSSGAPLSADAAVTACNQLGQAITEVYGSTETGGIAWREQTHGGDWHCLPGVGVAVDTDGLLQVKSPHLPNREAFITADQARITNAGFHLLGRADRIAKVGGKRISLTAVERLIGQHPFVREVRVTALPERDNRLGAVVILNADGCKFLQDCGKKALNAQLKQGLDQALERIAIPRYWRYPPDMPQNSQGKVTQAALQALFAPVSTAAFPLVLGREIQGTVLQLGLEIPPNLVYFEGHFPGNPVLPGVVQTHWAIHYAREYWGDLGSFAGLEAIKFQQLIGPGARLMLELEYAAHKGKLYFSYRPEAGLAAATLFSSGRILVNNET